MKKNRVLFICVHNAARSQMAEAFLSRLGADMFEADSAGLEPTSVNPLVIEVMRELGYDLSESRAKNVFGLYKAGMLFNYVITVCRESVEDKCPVFPGITKRLAWEFDDPATFQGSEDEKRDKTRKVRDGIKSKVESWIEEMRRPNKED